jgi:hypothetical protein
MPWSETTKMRERVRFMGDLERELFSMTELCQRYRISRQTGYKWVNRYFEEGLDWIQCGLCRLPGMAGSNHRVGAGALAGDILRVRPPGAVEP